MSLVFSAIAPHPPKIIPSIGGNELSKAQDTINALKELEGELYVAQPEVIFIISPHSLVTPEAFSLNLTNEFKSDLDKYGATEKELSFKCDLELISQIKEEADLQKISVNMISNTTLDHGISVPLFYLTQHIEKVKIVPISFSLLALNDHFEFGALLRKVANRNNKRVAIIASADLSHNLNKETNNMYSPESESFDHLLLSSLKEKNVKQIINMTPNLIEAAGECGLRSIVILLGALSGLDYKYKMLSYEAPYGIGYLVGQFNIS